MWDAEIERRGAGVDAGTADTMTLDEYREHVRRRRAARAVSSPGRPMALRAIGQRTAERLEAVEVVDRAVLVDVG